MCGNKIVNHVLLMVERFHKNCGLNMVSKSYWFNHNHTQTEVKELPHLCLHFLMYLLMNVMISIDLQLLFSLFFVYRRSLATMQIRRNF